MRWTASAAIGEWLSLHQVIELAADVGHAGCFLNRAILVEPPESGIRVSLQNAAEAGQMPLWMFAFSIRRVGEPDGGRCGVASRTAVADIGPEPPDLRSAGARRQHPQWRVVSMQLVGAHHITAQNLDQRLDQIAGPRRSSVPEWTDPDQDLRGHKSETADIRANGPQICPSPHGPEVRPRPRRDRLAGSAPKPGPRASRFGSSSSAAHDG